MLACLVLTACGGGGGDDAGLPPAAPVPDLGAVLESRVARPGASGTWGYIAADGSRYALMGTSRGVLVFDLRDSANPRVVDEIDGPVVTDVPGTWWREMRVRGSHAYIVSEHTDVRGGIMILDLSGLPGGVRFVKSVVPRDGQPAAHTIDIDTARGLLYLQRVTDLRGAGRESPRHPVGGPDDGSIEIYDIATDPENPRWITTFNQHRSVHDMTAVGERVYVAEGNAGSFSVWDVREPRAPTLVVRWSVGAFAHSLWPGPGGAWVVATEEIPNGRPARVWRLNGSTPPTPLASIKVGDGTPHNVIVEGTRAYFSHYSEGAAVFELADPAAPVLVARLDTNALAGPGLAGCWGVFKFPNEPLMACSDTATGFNLIRLTN